MSDLQTEALRELQHQLVLLQQAMGRQMLQKFSRDLSMLPAALPQAVEDFSIQYDNLLKKYFYI